MNIGFYGHSNCAYRSVDSFLDLVAQQYNGKIVNTGCKQGSEERILFELKKTKNIDLAIIFHCQHNSLFVPNSDRDIVVNKLTQEKARDLFRNDHLDVQFTKNTNPDFVTKFENNENLFNAVDTYKKFFYDPDLMLNRYYGALMQIDQYLTYKKIRAIHVLDINTLIPPWFNFTSGVIDNEIMRIARANEAKNPFFVNCISKNGNVLIADKLIRIINTI